jgi:MoaA/NifB/PqqE/SkfB family radical SAM enzyme
LAQGGPEPSIWRCNSFPLRRNSNGGRIELGATSNLGNVGQYEGGMQLRDFALRRRSRAWDRSSELRALSHPKLVDRNGRQRTLYLQLETVNLCNNNCLICAYREQERAKTHMAMEVFEKAIGDYADMGGGYVSLTPIVGDVLLDRFLRERIAFLEEVPSISGIGFTTNAAMAHRFDDKDLAAIISPLKHLSISVYGLDRAEYESMTQKTTYKRMVEGIRRMVDAASAQVWLEFRLLQKRSREYVECWVENEVGIKLGSKVSVKSIITNYANWGVFNEVNTPLPRDAKWFQFEPAVSRPQCLIPLLAFIVFSNGNVSFCPCDNFQDVEELRIGNVMDRSLSEIYNSEKARKLWDWAGSGVPAFCQKCSFHIPMAMLKSNPTIMDDPFQIAGAG